jgi:hypothetical protein
MNGNQYTWSLGTLQSHLSFCVACNGATSLFANSDRILVIVGEDQYVLGIHGLVASCMVHISRSKVLGSLTFQNDFIHTEIIYPIVFTDSEII